eukprot:6194880-Pleurochrysis_carterae.AAC.3
MSSMRSGSSMSDPISEAMSLSHRSKSKRARAAFGINRNAKDTASAIQVPQRYQQMSRVTREGSEAVDPRCESRSARAPNVM